MTPNRLHLTLAILAIAAATATAARPAADAAGMCQQFTAYPKLCEEAAQNVPAPTPQTLAHALIQATAIKMMATLAAVDQLAAVPSTKNPLRSCLEQCQEEYDLFKDGVKSCLTQVKNGDYVGLKYTLSGLMSYNESCDEGFSEFPNIVNPIAHHTDNLRKHIVNSIHMAADGLK